MTSPTSISASAALESAASLREQVSQTARIYLRHRERRNLLWFGALGCLFLVALLFLIMHLLDGEPFGGDLVSKILTVLPAIVLGVMACLLALGRRHDVRMRDALRKMRRQDELFQKAVEEVREVCEPGEIQIDISPVRLHSSKRRA